MPTINYNAALPAFSSISGRSSIDINKWVSELKFNISSLIKSLFANNEQGFAYDPNDLSTMYQDAAGTVPVTAVGQPVGLILDKSKGLVLGGESVVDSGFDDPTKWILASGTTISGSSLNISPTTIASSYQNIPSLSTGKVYKVDLDIKSISGTVTLFLGNTSTYYFSSVGVKTLYTRLGTNNNVGFNVPAGGAATIGYLSVKELVGNHAHQTTSSMRPLLTASPQRLDYDIVDDKLITTLPAQLTGCTVVRAVPNVGTQILTGQTILATYNDNTDHCGLIVINRALTPSETSAITAEFNKRAGV